MYIVWIYIYLCWAKKTVGARCTLSCFYDTLVEVFSKNTYRNNADYTPSAEFVLPPDFVDEV